MSALIEARPGDIYLGDSNASEIYRVGPGGGATSLVSTDPDLVAPNSVEFAADGRMIVVDYEAFGGLGGLLAVNRVDGSATGLAGGSPFTQPDGMALAPGGIAYVTDLSAAPAGVIFRVVLGTGAVTPVTSGGPLSAGPLGIAVDPTSGRIFADDSDTELVSVDPITGVQTVLSTGPTATPFQDLTGLTRLPDGALYVQDQGASRIYRVNARTGNAVKVAEDPRLNGSYDMTYDLNGNLLVAANDGVLRVDPRTGVVSEFVPPLGPGHYIEGVGLEPPLCSGKVATITGTNRPEKITGSPKADVIAGMGGTDQISGIGARDVICGGGGRDRLVGGKGRDKLIGGPGKDRVFGGPGRDSCIGDRARRRGC